MAATIFQFKTLENIYYYYNYKLFDSQLPECIITLARHRGAHGVFAPGRWLNAEKKAVNEILLNPETMNRPAKDWHSTLVHEACHHWQKEFGIYAGSYHNRQWANKMIELGLMPTNTGNPGGKKTGYSIDHYIIPGGAFDCAFNEITTDDLESLILPYQPNEIYSKELPRGEEERETTKTRSGRKSATGKGRSGVKATYVCGCANKVWGRSGLHFNCAVCGSTYAEQ